MRKPGALSGLWSFPAIVQAGVFLLGIGSREALAATIEIDGVLDNGAVKWVVGGQLAANVAVSPGDRIVWRAVSATHGVLFDTQTAAEGVLQFQTGGGLPALGPQT